MSDGARSFDHEAAARAMALNTMLQDHAQLPQDAPMGMPGGFYTNPARFAQEQAGLLRRAWHCVGRVDEIAEPGDHFTVHLLNEPVLVVRGEDASIRALSNVCRHRGMLLAEGRGSAKRFVCSYHAWTYGLDGALRRAPRMDNRSFDPKRCRLPSFPVHLWNGFIYVSLSQETQPFQVPKLESVLAPYEPDQFRLAHVEEEIWHCNWKCLVENFMEGYHLSVVHPQTLHGYTPTGLAKKLDSGDGYTAYAANYPRDIESRGHGAPGLSEDERHRSTLFALFPTQVASQAASLLVSLMLFPEAVDRVRVKWTLSSYGDEFDNAALQDRIRLWQEVNTEDREKLERLQIALRSQYAAAGPLAADDFEGTIRDFHRWLAHEQKP